MSPYLTVYLIHRCTKQRQNTSQAFMPLHATACRIHKQHKNDFANRKEGEGENSPILKNIAKHNKVKFSTVSTGKPHYNIPQICLCLPRACINLPWPHWFQGDYFLRCFYYPTTKKQDHVPLWCIPGYSIMVSAKTAWNYLLKCKCNSVTVNFTNFKSLVSFTNFKSFPMITL